MDRAGSRYEEMSNGSTLANVSIRQCSSELHPDRPDRDQVDVMFKSSFPLIPDCPIVELLRLRGLLRNCSCVLNAPLECSDGGARR